jgi:hypothetical protein
MAGATNDPPGPVVSPRRGRANRFQAATHPLPGSGQVAAGSAQKTAPELQGSGVAGTSGTVWRFARIPPIRGE